MFAGGFLLEGDGGIFTTEEAGEGHGGPRESGRFRVRRLQDVAADALGQAGGVEIQDQADVQAAHAEIGVALGFVDRVDGGDGFDFEDHFAGDDDIGLEAVDDRDGLVDQRDHDQAFEWNTDILWRGHEEFFIDLLGHPAILA